MVKKEKGKVVRITIDDPLISIQDMMLSEFFGKRAGEIRLAFNDGVGELILDGEIEIEVE